MRLSRRTLRLAGVGLAYAALQVGGLLATRPAGWTLSSYVWLFMVNAVWAVALPVVVWWAAARPLDDLPTVRRLLAHLGRAVVVSASLAIVNVLLTRTWQTLHGRPYYLRDFLVEYLTGGLLYDVIVYGLAVSAYSALALQKRLREKELRASQLEALLARTELELLRSQLDPHFVFNTLHTVAALIPRDPQAAGRIVNRLGDFLRVSLRSQGVQEIPLRREMEHLFAYLEIQRERFRDTLEIECVLAPVTLGALVPSLLLQPLLENSIKHGTSRPGRLRSLVTAAKKGDELVLEIVDDGPGFPPDVLDGSRQGVGLANSRRRLEKLYGEAQRLRIANRPEGGAAVTVTLPWRDAAPAAAPVEVPCCG